MALQSSPLLGNSLYSAAQKILARKFSRPSLQCPSFCPALGSLQYAVPNACPITRTTSSGSDLPEFGAEPTSLFASASQGVLVISPVWETCFLWLSQCFLQVNFRKRALFCPWALWAATTHTG